MPVALIIDDEVDLCRLMQMTLKKMQIDVKIAYDIAMAKEHLQQHHFDFCLTDLRLPDGSGLDIVRLIGQQYAKTPVAVITAHGNMDLAIEALKLGAFDFVNKPLELPKLRQLVENALKVAKDHEQTDEQQPDVFAGKLIGHSEPIQQLKQTIQKLARSQAPVFLWGGSGTGKEVVAKLIHDLSPRNQANFVPVNCGAIPSELMESEFFGHKKGSFTGATVDKEGLFQQANGGTLFLDEVADLPLAMQVKLLRAIQEKKVRPIGSTQEVAVDIRLLSATHKNLAKLVELGEFRQDLYYRINVIEVKLPSLNERKGDVLLLAEHFLQLISQDWGLDKAIILTDTAKQALQQHHYSGNVRELRNILERAITLADDDVIDQSHLNLQTTLIESPTSAITESISFVEPEKLVVPITENSPQNRVNHLNGQHIFGYNQTHFDTIPTIKQSLNIQTISPQITKPKAVENKTLTTTLAVSSTDLPVEGLEEYLLNQEKQLIITALNQSNWNKTQAAKLLNTSFRSLRYRMKKLGIGDDD